MKKDYCEILLILDESGSMESCKKDTIAGVNEFFSSQKKIQGEAKITLVKFSDYYHIMYDSIPLEQIDNLTAKNYTPAANTALLDAVGRTINSTGTRLAAIPEEQRPEKVLMVIITDGFENASVEFTPKQVKDTITHQREKYSWEFLFLGADVSAWGDEIGIDKNVNLDKADLKRAFTGLGCYTANYRLNSPETSLSNFDLTEEELKDKLNLMSN